MRAYCVSGFVPCDVGDTVMTDSLGPASWSSPSRVGRAGGLGPGKAESREKIREGCMEEEMA